MLSRQLALHAIESFKSWETLPRPFWQVGDWYEFTGRDGLGFGRRYMNFFIPLLRALKRTLRELGRLVGHQVSTLAENHTLQV